MEKGRLQTLQRCIDVGCDIFPVCAVKVEQPQQQFIWDAQSAVVKTYGHTTGEGSSGSDFEVNDVSETWRYRSGLSTDLLEEIGYPDMRK